MIFHVDIRKIKNSEINSSNSYCLKMLSDLAVEIHSRYVLFSGDRGSLCAVSQKSQQHAGYHPWHKREKSLQVLHLKRPVGHRYCNTASHAGLDRPEGQEGTANKAGRAGVGENRPLSR